MHLIQAKANQRTTVRADVLQQKRNQAMNPTTQTALTRGRAMPATEGSGSRWAGASAWRKMAMVLLAAVGLAGAGGVLAADVYLVAQPETKALPDAAGGTISVPTWKFRCDDDPSVPSNANCQDEPSADPTIIGARINAATGDTLTVHVRNTLPMTVSFMVPGQNGTGDWTSMSDSHVTPAGAADPRTRVRSFVHEVAPSTTGTYTFSSLRAGTYLYQSGTYPSLQVPMGLYGALIVGPGSATCASGQAAYENAGSCYDSDHVLLLAEIDHWQNQRLAAAAAANPVPTPSCVRLEEYMNPTPTTPVDGYPCTVDYSPVFFMVNGTVYDNASPPAPIMLTPGTVLLRVLNAGLTSHTPALLGLEMGRIAEDGNAYPGLTREQSHIFATAGKTLDILLSVPATDATYTFYDRMPKSFGFESLPVGGMVAKLQVGTGGGTTSPTPAAANDGYTFYRDTELTVDAAHGVLANDTALAGATLSVASGPANGTVNYLNNDGSFSYTPNPGFVGVDTFTYDAGGYTATVTLTSSNGAPTAADDGPYFNGIGATISVAAPGILGNDADPDGDPLTAALATAPANGTLTCDATASAGICADGSFTYTPNVGFSGSDTFTYQASDGLAAASTATVTVQVNPVSGLTLNVTGSDGTPVTSYRWIVQEDRMFVVDPSNPPATIDQQSVKFHKSYMPVVAQGCVGAECATDNPNIPVVGADQVALDPGKRYYLSVLPNDGGNDAGHTIGGGMIPVKPSTAPYPPVNVVVNETPTPTAQVSILAFEDNAPTNGVWDAGELGVGGWQVILEDGGGRYGIAAGTASQDVYGNPLKNSLDCFADAPPPPTGVVLTCPDTAANRAAGVVGQVLIKDLAPAKYGVTVVPPAATGETWLQTSTIEGTKINDAWLKANEPSFLVEAGGTGPHVWFGFVNPAHSQPPAPGGHSIDGRVTLLHDPRPPAGPGTVDSGSYVGLAHTRAWVGLNTIAGDGPNIMTVQADEDGYFHMDGIPDGNYQLVVWDTYLDQVISFLAVNVAGANVTEANVAVPGWFTRQEHYVFLDTGCPQTEPDLLLRTGVADGIRQDCEPGLPDQNVNIRWRDGTVFQTFPTDTTGFVPFDQVFPFFSWQIAEIDYLRFKPTGVTVVVDAGGDVSGGPYPGLLNPQQQADGSYQRTETGPVLLEAFQGFPGQTNLFEWGKAPYLPGENGGIAGIVFYGSTRAENDPRYAVGEPWEPGVPGVKVRLYRDVASAGSPSRLVLVQEVVTDSWDAAPPEGCPGEDATSPFTTETLGGDVTRCYDGWRNWNQTRPGVFDGGYAFMGLEPGSYVVEVLPPPGYELIKEEDKNVDFGESYTIAPVDVLLAGGALLAAVPDQAMVIAAQGVEPGLAQPPCVGEPHLVPPQLSLFPGVDTYAPFANAYRPLCNRKRVVLSDQGQAAADFHLFTSAPIAAQFTGLLTDDVATETNPASPGFGEKWSPPYVPVVIRDWKGHAVYQTYSDGFGHYNGVLPSTYSANIPAPSGYSPSMHQICLNDPGDGPILDPNRLTNYGIFCYTLQFMPGTTTYADTPLLPGSAFAAGYNPPDCAAPVGKPVVMRVQPAGGGGAGGPLVAPGGNFQIFSAGNPVAVPNPAYEGPNAPAPYNVPTVDRDLSFGQQGPGSKVELVQSDGTRVALTINNWNPGQINATAPASAMEGHLVVTRANGQSSLNTVTLTVGNETAIVVPSAGISTIQGAIDAAAPGQLVIVKPGTYYEQVIMWKPVRLQGSGAATIINGIKRPPEVIAAWNAKVQGLFDGGLVDPQPGLTTIDTANDLAPDILVLAKNDGSFNSNPSRVDGFTLTGADVGGAMVVNSYAHNLLISNNLITQNQGSLSGGIRVGHPNLPGIVPNASGFFGFNNNVRIEHNSIALNAGLQEFTAGGGVTLNTGTDNYRVRHNFICGNFANADGGGVGHYGLSNDGRIEFNEIRFNQSLNQGLNQHGGGIFAGGEPGQPPVLTLGTGALTIDANLIKGNHAASGHGGGLRLQLVDGVGAATPYPVTVSNNMIVNNVAGWAGGGVSVVDAVDAHFVNNTIANNDSTATVGTLIVNNLSVPQPAGVSVEPYSPGLQAALTLPAGSFPSPEMLNNIVWRNRAFHYDTTVAGSLAPTLTPGAIGGCAAGATYWDLGVLGQPSSLLNPTYSILTDPTYAGGSNNVGGDPAFLSEYCNSGRQLSVVAPMIASAAFGEGGNFIDVRYGPLTTEWPVGSGAWDYHVAATTAGLDNGGAGAPDHDYDSQDRPMGAGVDRGADEVFVPGNVTFASASPYGIVGGTMDFGTQPNNANVSSTVTISVSGNAVTFTAATVTGNGTFSKGADTCTGTTVSAGGTCTVVVNFSGQGGGNKSATLSLYDNGAGSPQTLNVTGQ